MAEPMLDITRLRVADRVYEELRAAVLAGELTPGERLSIPRLAVRYGVSRSPAREAVQRLVRDGLAVESPQRGAAVAAVAANEIVPLYEVREVLEGLAARLAATRATREELAGLQAELHAHETAVATGDMAGHLRHDLAFHARLRQATDNPELSATLDRVQGKVTVAMLAADHASWPAKAVAEHRAVLEAVVAADPAAAEAAARAHIARIRADLAEGVS